MTPPSTTSRRPQLADLSEEDRARLLADARAADEKEATEKATGRAEKFASQLRERDHLDGCPVFSGELPSLGRVEAYGAVKPASQKTGEPAKPMTVIRCIECGGSTVKPTEFDAFLEQLEELDEPAAGETDDDDSDA